MAANEIVPNLAQARLDRAVAAVQGIIAALKGRGLIPHDGIRTAVADGGTADLAAVLVIANALKAAYNLHCASTSEHVAADATNLVTAAAATDQGTADTLLNDIKAKFNLHLAYAASHRGPTLASTVVYTVATTDSSSLATSKTLAAALLIAINAHFAAGVPTFDIGPA